MMLIVVCDWLQRALPMRVITVGKTRSIGVQNITLEYTKKIQHYCRFEDVQVRSNPKNTRHGLPPTITTTAATIFPILDAVLFCWFIGDGVVLCIAKWMDSFIFITPSLIELGFFSLQKTILLEPDLFVNRDVSAQIASEGENVMRLISAKEWVCSTYQFCSSNNLFLIFAFSNLQRNLLQICCVQGYAIVCVADYDVEDVN